MLDNHFVIICSKIDWSWMYNELAHLKILTQEFIIGVSEFVSKEIDKLHILWMAG